MNSHCCHGSNSTPKMSRENSMTSNPRVVSGVRSRSGGVHTLGSAEPTNCAPIQLNHLLLQAQTLPKPGTPHHDEDHNTRRHKRDTAYPYQNPKGKTRISQTILA